MTRLVSLLAMLVLVTLNFPTPMLAAESKGPPANPKPGDTYTNPRDGSVLVWVPGGEFPMGSNDGDEDEKPVVIVKVEGFWMGKFEVTNAQYARFVKETGSRKPLFDEDPRFNQPNFPVVGLTWKDALTYCAWGGLRLPTEAEWEYAAAGGKKLRYPTSTGELNHKLANCLGWKGKDGKEGLAPVGSFPANPFGLHDMAGNTWEWTTTTYEKYPYNATDGREDIGKSRAMRVLRGGSWNSPLDECRTSYRRRFATWLTYDWAGFRVAASLKGLAITAGEGEGAPPPERTLDFEERR